MVTIEIFGWGEAAGGTGWDALTKSELKKRLRSGLDASLSDIKRLTRQLHGRVVVSLLHVREEAVLGVTQILRAMGAETRVTLESGNDERLFKKWPKR
jgi:hypothetical protein